jgi:primosomal protein N' (replication factor Y)
VISLGVGTQKLETEILDRFGDVLQASELERADGDSMRSAADWFDVLRRFASGQIKVLLGTQMISKGLDFPNVTLAGVINADTGLSLPDFRASERTFQLITQVAGRAGRGAEPGLVIVQTVNPGEPAIRFAAQHDYVGFAAQELDVRQRAGLPPAMRMVRIVVRDEDHIAARARADQVATALRAEMKIDGLRLLGPAPCSISRIAGQYRFGIELIAPRAADIQSILAAARAKGAIKSDATTSIDVDPVALS